MKSIKEIFCLQDYNISICIHYVDADDVDDDSNDDSDDDADDGGNDDDDDVPHMYKFTHKRKTKTHSFAERVIWEFFPTGWLHSISLSTEYH